MLDGIFDKIALGLALILIAMSIWVYTLKQELAKCEATNAGVQIVGQLQEKETVKKDTESKEDKVKIDESYNTGVAELRADNERLRNKIASSSKLPKSPQVCTGGNEATEVNWPKFDEAIRTYRQRVREITERGSEAEKGLDSVKGFYWDHATG